MKIAVGARIQRTAAHGDATEATWSWTKATQPTDTATVASDRVAGADSLGAAQTHGSETEEMQTQAGD